MSAKANVSQALGATSPPDRQAGPTAQVGSLSSEEYRLLVETFAQATWETDGTGMVVADSPSWRAYTGQTPEQWLNQGWIGAVHPDDREHSFYQWHKALYEQAPYNVDVRLRTARGDWQWTNVRATPVRSADGPISKWIGIAIDITGRIETALKTSEDKYRTLFESIDEGFCIIEVLFEPDAATTELRAVDYRFLEVNPSFERQTGLENAAGRRMLDMAPLEPHWFEIYGRVALTGEPVRFEERAEPLHRWYDVYAFRVGEPQDHHVAVLFNDISPRRRMEKALRESEARLQLDIVERKRAEHSLLESETRYRKLSAQLDEQVQQRTRELMSANKELEEANSLLMRSNERLQQFAYVASHDLQEPLRKIRQFSDLLRNGYAEALGNGVTYLERMQMAAGRMSMLIQDLLTYSRVSAHGDTAVVVSLNEMLKMVLTDLELVIDERRAMISAELLPTILGDPMQLRQLLQNLLSNALKFHRTDEKGAPITPIVQIRYHRINADALPPSVKPVRQASRYHQITVADNGIGFDEKYLDRIFEMFQRLHGKATFEGTGIGLAICQRVVENHGGSITAHSQPGQGATFYIYLPLEA